MKKYIFLILEIRNGEYEYESLTIHEIDSRKNSDEFAEKYASNFYGSKGKKEDYGYYFNNGEVAVEVKYVKEATKAEYEVLKKFLH